MTMKKVLWALGAVPVIVVALVWAVALLFVAVVAFVLFVATYLCAKGSDAVVVLAEWMGRIGRRACDWYVDLLH